MFQLKPAQDLAMFQASQIRNPWAQQQLHTALMPTNPEQLLGMSKEWGTSYVSPEVQMHIVSQSADTPENTTKNSNSGKENNTQNTWTSAEELANAIFPTNYESNATHSTQVHHGLLNHKVEIENLRQEAEANTTRATQVHTGLLNHKVEIENLKQEAEANTTRASQVHTGLINHKMEIEQLKKSLTDLQTNSILLSTADARTNHTNRINAFSNTKVNLDHLHEGLITHKSAIEKQSHQIQSLETSLAHLNPRESSNVSLQHVNEAIEQQNKKIKILQESLNLSHDSDYVHKGLLDHKNIISQHNNALNTYKNELQGHDVELQHLRTALQDLKKDRNLTLHLKDELQLYAQKLNSVQQLSNEHNAQISALQMGINKKDTILPHTSIDNLVCKFEELENNNRHTHAQITMLKQGHNALLDAHKTSQEQIKSLLGNKKSM
jgi:chromosome segregation ATPase